MPSSICVDFDRVIHSYTTKWKDALTISDPPNVGAFEWLTEMVKHFNVYVFSSRSEVAGSEAAIQAWMLAHGLDSKVVHALLFTSHKPAALIYIDDRAFRFQGRFPTADEISMFKPWHPDDGVDSSDRTSIARAIIDQSRQGALPQLVEELRKTVSGELVLSDIREQAVAHFDVEDRMHHYGLSLIDLATEQGQNTLVSYHDCVKLGTNTYRLTIERVEN